jgi:chemotaxis protein MotA
MRLDIATIIGIAGGFALIGIGIIITPGASLLMFWDPASVMIVVGGATACTLINFPLRDLANLWRVTMLAFREDRLDPNKLIGDFRRYADIARRDGILALENVTHEVKDPFLVRGIQLAVDGTDPEMIQTMMRTELDYIQDRHNRGIRILKQLGTYAPSFGMIGTLIGLVIMLANLSDPSKIGPSMAVAIITTFYGAILAYLVAIPLGEKLTIRNNEEALVKEMMIKGVMSLQSGDNPRIVEQKLKIFLAPKLREAEKWK